MYFRKTLPVEGQGPRPPVAPIEIAPVSPRRITTPRFHYLTDPQPLQTTSCLKGYNLQRSRGDAFYKRSEPNLLENDGKTRLVSWKVLRWAVVPLLLLLLLGASIFAAIWATRSAPLEITNSSSSEGEAVLLDLEAHSSLIRVPVSDESSLQRLNANNLEHLLNPLNLTEAPSSAEDASFIDRLISTFEGAREKLNRNVQGEPVEGLSVKQFTSTGETGYVRRHPPNGHKYGELKSVPSVTKYLGMSTSTSPPVSPTLPSLPPRGVSPQPSAVPQNLTDSNCTSPQLPMCRGINPWDLTTLPSLPGTNSLEALREAMPYYELVRESGCSPRAGQFLCSLLEPECRPMGQPVRRPCRSLCKAVAEDCNDFILDLLDLSQVFNCDNYPEEGTENCITLSRDAGCLKNEVSCGDGTCVPVRWRCNGHTDCRNGADEANCTVCNKHQFTCGSKERCVPLEWKCDGHSDCDDDSDESDCEDEEEMVMHSHASPCPAGELRCVDARCITVSQICDGAKDCSDGADEANCRIPYT